MRDELLAVLPHLRRLPERVDRILSLTGRGELRIRTVIDEDSRRILRTLVNRALLGAIGAAVLAVSAMLLVAADAGPGGRRGHRPVRDLRLRRPAGRQRCSCCASSPPSPGTARRDASPSPELTTVTPGDSAPCVHDRPPGERYYRHPGDIVRLVVWERAIVVFLLFIDVSTGTSDGVRTDLGDAATASSGRCPASSCWPRSRSPPWSARSIVVALAAQHRWRRLATRRWPPRSGRRWPSW